MYSQRGSANTGDTASQFIDVEAISQSASQESAHLQGGPSQHVDARSQDLDLSAGDYSQEEEVMSDCSGGGTSNEMDDISCRVSQADMEESVMIIPASPKRSGPGGHVSIIDISDSSSKVRSEK